MNAFESSGLETNIKYQN